MNETVSALQKERDLSDELASLNLSRDSLSRWNACRSSMRFMSFIDKELIAYRVLFGKAQILNRFKCHSVSMTGPKGMSSVWFSEDSQFTVGYAPVEVYEGCFMFHIRNTSVEYDQYKGKFGVRFSMRYKTLLNPHSKAEGSVFLLERAVFDSIFG